jgi:chloramphenicol-sensitive protein RarD
MNDDKRLGYAAGIAAYTAWGVIPAYFKLLIPVPPDSIVAHRVAWSLPLLALALLGLRRWDRLVAVLKTPKLALALAASAVLIGVNWLLYVYAINSGHILAGSLGYYLNPLANILLGRFVLHERLERRQWIAVAIAAAGVAVLAAGALTTLWISLGLCLSFASYGMIRKLVPVDSVTGLAVETLLLFPVAIGWLFLAGPSFGSLAAHPGLIWLLVGTGLISTVPLLLFTEAARRLPYSTVGMLQFLAPTLQFLLAVAFYGEALSTAHLVAFGAIWAALALYASALIGSRPKRRLAEGSVEAQEA